MREIVVYFAHIARFCRGLHGEGEEERKKLYALSARVQFALDWLLNKCIINIYNQLQIKLKTSDFL